MKVKYGRTYHFPWSKSLVGDDKMIESIASFEGKRVVVTEKMDGENTTIYADGQTHARSLDSKYHPSRTFLKQKAATLQANILMADNAEYLQKLRFCGENTYAQHQIEYVDLEDYFLLFSIWDGEKALDWDQTMAIAKQLGLKTVPILYDGVWDEKKIQSIFETTLKDGKEGIVVRVAEGFLKKDMESFQPKIAKAVRKGHVNESEEHWMSKPVIPNKLKN